MTAIGDMSVVILLPCSLVSCAGNSLLTIIPQTIKKVELSHIKNGQDSGAVSSFTRIGRHILADWAVVDSGHVTPQVGLPPLESPLAKFPSNGSLLSQVPSLPILSPTNSRML